MTVSITAVIPTFDRPELLLKAITSVLHQTAVAEEVIVVDNGVSPVNATLLPAGVQLLRIAPRAGVSAARNAGALAAVCDYVAFLDDDDRWDPSYLEEVRRTIASHPTPPDVTLGRKDREIDGVVSRYKEITALDGLRDVLMVKNPGVGGQNITVRQDFFRETNGFRTALHGPEDRAFLVDALDHGATVALAPRAIVVKVIHPGEQITDGRHSLRSTWRFLRIYWRSMGRPQRVKNLRRLRRALLQSAVRAVRSPTKGHG